MFHHQEPSGSQANLLGENLNSTQNPQRQRRSVFLESAQGFYTPTPNTTQVGPAPIKFLNDTTHFGNKKHGTIFDMLKPIYLLMRVVGIYPISDVAPGVFKVSPKWMGHSIVVFLFISGYIAITKLTEIEMIPKDEAKGSNEGRFEEAVIDYLFTVYLIPIIVNPIMWYEARKLASVITDWVYFEKLYNRVTKKKLSLFLGNKPLLTTIALPILSCVSMVVTNFTMGRSNALEVLPFCYINTITYLVGGYWFIQCDIVGKAATQVAEDFQMALKHLGPTSQIADYRSLWMLLSKLIRDTGNASGYTVAFLCLYLFMIMTLTIYGLLSQIQGGFGTKDIGLTITAVSAIGFLYFISDEAHYASNCVRVQFQKKLLLVELTWINDDGQQEINMFLRATEMSQTEMSLVGFFDVNRNLFKSLLATMVTYLVVLLQFQISIPEDTSIDFNSTVVSTTASPK